ncbi:MAG: hypothetical protein GTO14_12175 [Anaerolineales bacterium]|nr:hypothetical protein [Anaerolineales bacterium]
MMYPGIFAMVVGLGMIGHWMFSYLTKNIPELEDEPIRIGFHVVAEMVTALSLLVAGLGLLVGEDWAQPLYLVALGMLFYTAIVSPGYFAQKGNWKWLGGFIALISAGLIALAIVA